MSILPYGEASLDGLDNLGRLHRPPTPQDNRDDPCRQGNVAAGELSSASGRSGPDEANLLMKHEPQPAFPRYAHAYGETVAASQGPPVVELGAGNDRINPLGMKGREIDARGFEKQMTRVLEVVLIHCVVYDSLQVALVVADIHRYHETV